MRLQDVWSTFENKWIYTKKGSSGKCCGRIASRERCWNRRLLWRNLRRLIPNQALTYLVLNYRFFNSCLQRGISVSIVRGKRWNLSLKLLVHSLRGKRWRNSAGISYSLDCWNLGADEGSCGWLLAGSFIFLYFYWPRTCIPSKILCQGFLQDLGRRGWDIRQVFCRRVCYLNSVHCYSSCEMFHLNNSTILQIVRNVTKVSLWLR